MYRETEESKLKSLRVKNSSGLFESPYDSMKVILLRCTYNSLNFKTIFGGDKRSYALYRISLGIVILFDLINR